MDRDQRIKILAEHLIWAINQAYVDSELIKEALHQIEEEGYQVDILLAAFTRFDQGGPCDEDEILCDQAPHFFHRREEDDDELAEEVPLSSEFNDFDHTFLKLIKVGFLEGN